MKFTDIIICVSASFVIQFSKCITQTVISSIDLKAMAGVRPIVHIAPIRIPFQFVHTISIITYFIVWIPQSRPKLAVGKIIFWEEENYVRIS